MKKMRDDVIATVESQTVGLTTHALHFYSLLWLTELFKSNSVILTTLSHLVLFATEYFPFKIQGANITMDGKVLRGHFYIFVRIKTNSSFPSSP